MSPRLSALFAIAFLLAAKSSSRAQETWGPSSSVGGGGGSNFRTLTCPSGKHVVGLELHHGTYVHGLRLECARLGANGEHQTPEITNYGLGGPKTGASLSMLRCFKGYAAVGIFGQAGWWIDRIGLTCKKWRNGTTEGGALKTISFGGPGGRAYSLACPSGGYGLYKVYGWWKDELFGSTVVSHDISCRTA